MRLPNISTGPWALRRHLVNALRPQTRSYNAAVLGGGLTGLSAAWKMSKDPECTQITLYEKASRLGGWLQSETVQVKGGHVLFEYGPRTIRSVYPGAFPTAMLACSLGLTEDLILTSKDSPAAMNRYIYYPDHLVRLPGPQKSLSFFQNASQALKTLTAEPLFDSFLLGLIQENFNPARPPSEYAKDESIREFISRRFNSQMADNLVSAMMHGIYAGDIDKLSAQTLLGKLRNMEADGIVRTMLSKRGSKTVMPDNVLGMAASLPCPEAWQDIVDNASMYSSTFTFTHGVQQLADALVKNLEESPVVKIVTNAEVQGLARSTESDDLRISTSSEKDSESFNRVIATIPTPALHELISHETNESSRNPLPHKSINSMKSHNYATTVMVVNLYYPNPNLLKEEGFGYLIPRSIPLEENPDCALGVIFASSSSKGKRCDLVHDASQDTVEGTKLTIMFGGHYWDGWSESDYPDHESAVRMAQRTLERHLGITETPEVVRSRLQVNAIPQYTVGHLDRMYAMSKAVKEDFNHRLVLAGNWYNGVSVNDCVRQGLVAGGIGIGRYGSDATLGAHLASVGFSGYEIDVNMEDWDLEGGIPMAPVRLATLG